MVPEPSFGGRDLSDIAEVSGCTEEQACDRLQPAGAIYFMMDELDVQRIIKYPHSMVAFDGPPNDQHADPRRWGTFTRVLGHYSRKLGLLSLENAVYKMSGKPAEVFGLTGHGQIREDYFANIVVFEPKTVIDTADFENPVKASIGIDTVFVNGRVVWQDGVSTDARPGRVIRRQNNSLR